MSLLNALAGVPAKLAQMGLAMTDSAACAVQATLERAARLPKDPGLATPVDGPRDLDHALSEMANRTLRIIHFPARFGGGCKRLDFRLGS